MHSDFENGYTALMFAAIEGDEIIVDVLVACVSQTKLIRFQTFVVSVTRIKLSMSICLGSVLYCHTGFYPALLHAVCLHYLLHSNKSEEEMAVC